MPGANDNMQMSEAGYTTLRFNEGVVMHYCNDAPVHGNCTWGIGTLAHLGPCTPEEPRRTVLPEQVNAILQSRVHDAERQVRAIVTEHQLTRAQFDAAVSFAYKSNNINTRQALSPANSGNMATVVSQMMSNVMIAPRRANGSAAGPARRSRGLEHRRMRESAPFRQSAK